jgi:hypothetical protein
MLDWLDRIHDELRYDQVLYTSRFGLVIVRNDKIEMLLTFWRRWSLYVIVMRQVYRASQTQRKTLVRIACFQIPEWVCKFRNGVWLQP